MSDMLFYRVGNIDSNQGLWYDMDGNFTGLIHGKYSFCRNSELHMPYDPAIAGYLSAVDNLEDLDKWFSRADMDQLEKFGYRILEYRASDYKTHNGHWLINQHSSVVCKVL